MWQKIKELNEQRAKHLADMKAILKKAEDNKRDLNAEETKAFDELRGKAEVILPQIERLQQTQNLDLQIREAAGNGRLPGREPIDPDRPLGETRSIDGFAVKDLRRYSLLRAIRLLADKKPLDGVEKEISDELSKRCGRNPQSFFFPSDLPTGLDFQAAERRALDLTAGAGAIATILDVSNFIELLRNRVVVQRAGARTISGLTGNLALPKQTAASSWYWVADSSAPTASNETIGQVTFSPNTGGAYTDLSRKFIMQSSVSAESFVRDDLARIAAIGIDLAALNGSGANNQPLGILQNGSVGVISNGANGGALTFTQMVAMEEAVATANADVGSLAYVTNPKVRAALKTTLRAPASGNYVAANFVWEDDGVGADGMPQGMVNGYRAFATNQIPSNLTKGTGTNLSAAIYGNWNDLVIGYWGQLDILVDPYTGSNTGTVRIVALQDVDIKLRHNESFQIMNDIIAS